MSQITVNFRPASLDIAARFHMFRADYKLAWEVEGNPHYNRPPKTLIILHGYAGDETEWTNYGRAEMLSRIYNLNVVLPNGYCTFWLDKPAKGHNFCTYVGKDLIEYLRDAFHIAMTREDTIIAGESMGGFGALHTAFAYPENFGQVLALSSGLIHKEVSQMRPETGGNMIANYEYYEDTFGDPRKLLASDNNPEVLVKRALAQGKPVPEIVMACGTEDFLLPTNIDFNNFLKENGIDAEMFVGEGSKHDFTFWNAMVDKYLPQLLRD